MGLFSMDMVSVMSTLSFLSTMTSSTTIRRNPFRCSGVVSSRFWPTRLAHAKTASTSRRFSDRNPDQLYRQTIALMNLAPNQQSEQPFRQLLGACNTIVGSLYAIRNRFGDAHGRSEPQSEGFKVCTFANVCKDTGSSSRGSPSEGIASAMSMMLFLWTMTSSTTINVMYLCCTS